MLRFSKSTIVAADNLQTQTNIVIHLLSYVNGTARVYLERSRNPCVMQRNVAILFVFTIFLYVVI